MEQYKVTNEVKSRLDHITAKSLNDETYYITLKNEDGSMEKVLSLSCSEEEARKAFYLVIEEQGRAFRRPGAYIKWRQIRLFDTKTGQMLCQES
ncbi:MAG: hypothetical protein IJR08_02075 [Bacilli bacterium]|nr:hypothetical protein [Bacilli bacterium]